MWPCARALCLLQQTTQHLCKRTFAAGGPRGDEAGAVCAPGTVTDARDGITCARRFAACRRRALVRHMAHPSSSTTVVLRKRKRPASPLCLRLSASPAPSQATSTEYEPPDAGPSTPPKKRYACDFDGCDKAYSKPARLAEHQRSHTGDVRPSSILVVPTLTLAAEAIRLQNLQQVVPARKPSPGPLALAPARVRQAVPLPRARVRQALLDAPASPRTHKPPQGRETLQGASPAP